MEEKVKFRGIFRDKLAENRPISREFRGSFQGKLHQKAIGKKQPIKTANFGRNGSVLY